MGFGLYEFMFVFFVVDLFGWVIFLFGSDFIVWFIYYGVMWLMIFFIIIYVYLVFYYDWLEGWGEVFFMFSGYKFVLFDWIKLEDMLEGESLLVQEEEFWSEEEKILVVEVY